MSTATSFLSAFVPALESARSPSQPSRPGLVVRLITAVQKARIRQAEREVARFVERNGSRMTDGMERAIERHFV